MPWIGSGRRARAASCRTRASTSFYQNWTDYPSPEIHELFRGSRVGLKEAYPTVTRMVTLVLGGLQIDGLSMNRGQP